jgi:hypothetical protein
MLHELEKSWLRVNKTWFRVVIVTSIPSWKEEGKSKGELSSPWRWKHLCVSLRGHLEDGELFCVFVVVFYVCIVLQMSLLFLK